MSAPPTASLLTTPSYGSTQSRKNHMTHVSESIRFNVAMSGVHANWYDHIDKVETAIKQEEFDSRCFIDAGWDCDEGGCYWPFVGDGMAPIHESEWWDELGRPLPNQITEYNAWMKENHPEIDPYGKAPDRRKSIYQPE